MGENFKYEVAAVFKVNSKLEAERALQEAVDRLSDSAYTDQKKKSFNSQIQEDIFEDDFEGYLDFTSIDGHNNNE